MFLLMFSYKRQSNHEFDHNVSVLYNNCFKNILLMSLLYL